MAWKISALDLNLQQTCSSSEARGSEPALGEHAVKCRVPLHIVDALHCVRKAQAALVQLYRISRVEPCPHQEKGLCVDRRVTWPTHIILSLSLSLSHMHKHTRFLASTVTSALTPSTLCTGTQGCWLSKVGEALNNVVAHSGTRNSVCRMPGSGGQIQCTSRSNVAPLSSSVL